MPVRLLIVFLLAEILAGCANNMATASAPSASTTIRT